MFCGTSYTDPTLLADVGGRGRTSATTTLRLHDPRQQYLLKLSRIHLHQVRREISHSRIRYRSVPVVRFDKFDIPQPEDDGQRSENAILLVGRETDDTHRALKVNLEGFISSGCVL